MKRGDLIRHLLLHGCLLKREGKKHSIYLNPAKGVAVPVKRHHEIDNLSCKLICRQLGIDDPK
jgi:hypothetical protein